MKPSEFYQELLSKIDDDLGRRVIESLSRNMGRAKAREELILELFGVRADKSRLAQDPHDRMIRKAIEALRMRGFPIIATSGEAGYTLVDDPDRIDGYIAEEAARMLHIQRKIAMLYKAKDASRGLREWREATSVPQQLKLPV